MWDWCQHRHSGNSETNPCMYSWSSGLLTMRDQTMACGENKFLHQMVTSQLDIHKQKNETTSFPHTLHYY